jgi:ubiquinone/menaquinone biosynthesis C-methylase UbiE
MLTDREQKEHYDRIMSSRRPTRGAFSCGYDTRYDPFLLDARPELAPGFEALFRMAFPQPAGRLLDIGCGSGMYFPLLSRRAERLVGIDISHEMIKAARRLIDGKGLDNVEAMQVNAVDLPFEDGSFDSVIAFDVLHHVPDTDAAMAEVSRVLRPGGRFVSIEPNVLNPIVFAAHLIPKEERRALLRNYPWTLYRLVGRHIGRPSSRYVNHVTSLGSRPVTRLLNFLEKAMQFWPMRYFGIRMLWTAVKR